MIELEVKVLVQNEGADLPYCSPIRSRGMFYPLSLALRKPIPLPCPSREAVTPRPLTHDLMLALCGQLGLSLKEVVITDVRENTFYAEVRFLKDGEEIVLDSRPSDAIALAVRVGAPIYMTNRLLEFTLNFHDITFKDDGSGSQGLH